MKRRWKKYLLNSIAILSVCGLVLFLIRLGYSYSWTGFGEFTPNNPDTIRSKTFWDWMELLIIPSALTVGAIILNRSERALERKTAEDRAKLERDLTTDRQREEAFQSYIDRMEVLILEKKLRTTRNKEVREVARTRTLSVLRGLDGTRKGLLVLFLYEANLIIGNRPCISLKKADLSYAEMQFAELPGVNLAGANLYAVNLEAANLFEADLIETDLRDADLSSADLSGAHLYLADLSDANLFLTHFHNADLTAAEMTIEVFHDDFFSGATLPNGKK